MIQQAAPAVGVEHVGNQTMNIGQDGDSMHQEAIMHTNTIQQNGNNGRAKARSKMQGQRNIEKQSRMSGDPNG